MRGCSAVPGGARSESCQTPSPAIPAWSVARRSLSVAGSKIVGEQLQLLTDGRQALRGGLARYGRDHRLHASSGRRDRSYDPLHLLTFLPLPHQQGSLRPTWCSSSTMRCSTTGMATCSGAPSCIAPAGAATPAAGAAAASAPAPTALRPPE